jgi:hypothetical protein
MNTRAVEILRREYHNSTNLLTPTILGRSILFEQADYGTVAVELSKGSNMEGGPLSRLSA